MRNDPALKPCPKCHNAYIAKLEGEFVVVCDCNPWGRTKEDAIDRWNKRIMKQLEGCKE